eukprot:2088033-Amphidinium_carterae.1
MPWSVTLPSPFRVVGYRRGLRRRPPPCPTQWLPMASASALAFQPQDPTPLASTARAQDCTPV